MTMFLQKTCMATQKAKYHHYKNRFSVKTIVILYGIAGIQSNWHKQKQFSVKEFPSNLVDKNSLSQAFKVNT